jgi:hypothetical protein
MLHHAGELIHRVSIASVRRDGETETPRQELTDVPAKCERLSGGLVFVDTQVQGKAQWTVLLRYDPRLHLDMRVSHDRHTLDVTAILDTELRVWQTLLCEERPEVCS